MITLNTKSLIAGAAVLITAPSIALAAVSLGDVVGTTDEEIRAKLEAAGYVIDEIEREDGEIEVEATLDGQELEFVIAPDTGTVMEMELDD